MLNNNLKTIFLVVILAAGPLCLCADAAGNNPAGKGGASIIRISGAIDLAVALPPGWNPSQKPNCVSAPGGKNYCAFLESASDLLPCNQLQMVARFKYIPGDKSLKFDLLPLPASRPYSRGITSECIARVISPSNKALIYIIVYEIQGSMISFVSDRYLLGKDVDADKIPAIEKDIKSIMRDSAFAGSPGFKKLVPEYFAATGRPNFAAIKSESAGYSSKPRPKPLIDADILKLSMKTEDSFAAYEKLSGAYPYDSLIGIGDIYFSKREFENAVKKYEEARAIDPGRPDAYNGIGSVLLLQHKTDEAEKYYKTAMEKSPGNPSSHANMGWLLLSRKEYIEAERNFMYALARSPDLDTAASATNGLTEIALYYNEPAMAIAWNKQFLSIFPDYAESHANILRAALHIGNIADAVHAAETLIRLRPGAPGAEILAGRAFYAAGDYARAAQHLCPLADSPISTDSDLDSCRDATDKISEQAR
ncbi:MAG TPA: tetratricopeptide repeat protein [bacterium]|nr:tetratricopeptide repeat protein [bacterium]